MSESFENADCSFTFDTSLLDQSDLDEYANIIYELAVVTPSRKKEKNEDFVPDSDILDNNLDNIERDDVDMNQTHLTEEFTEIFSYFDQDVEELKDGSDEELNPIGSDFKEFNDERINEKSDIENIPNNFQRRVEGTVCKTDTAIDGNFLGARRQASSENVSNRCNNIANDKLIDEIRVGSVKEKVLMYNNMLQQMNEKLESEKKFFRKKIEENAIKENSSTDVCDSQQFDDVDKTIVTIGDFDLLSKYVKKLSSIESYSQIISRLNRLVGAISQLDKNRLNGMNAKSLKNFLHFIKIYSSECVNMSTAIRKDIAIDLEKNVLTPEDLLYCLDVVAKEVN